MAQSDNPLLSVNGNPARISVFGQEYIQEYGIHQGGWIGGNLHPATPIRGIFSFAGEENLHDSYIMGPKLGAGQFGTTYRCTDRYSGRAYACKTIPKVKLATRADTEDVRREVAIMYHVAGNDHIVNIKGAYEDAENVHIVMDLCAGGELYESIVERMQRNNGIPYSERDAAAIGKVIAKVVEVCHSLGVMHRDLKPENFLLTSRGPHGELKITDFGLSTFFKPEETFDRHCGSPMYMAPEVVRVRAANPAHRTRYGPEADIWSAGVILYALLCGFPPFYAKSQSTKDIYKAILRGSPTYDAHPWPSISKEGKELVQWMLQVDPKKRATAHQVLTHPWVQEPGVAPEDPLDPVVISRLKQFSAMVKLKKVAMRVIAENMREEEIAGLKEFFVLMDADGSGTITLEELAAGLKKLGADMTQAEIENLMEETDIDKSGEIEYGEFLAGTLHLSKIEKQETLLKTFTYFDKDGSGYITREELEHACADLGLANMSTQEMIREADADHDGMIDYAEFVAMMRKNNNNAGGRRDYEYVTLSEALNLDDSDLEE